MNKKLSQEAWNIYQRKRWWAQYLNGKMPKICPLAEEDTRYPPEYNTLEDLRTQTNTAKRCKLYNENLECRCWFREIPGRCDCWLVYWDCPVFRSWVKMRRE